MATASQLFTDRDTAGATYASALAALRTAWINLRALDIACSNNLVLKAHGTAKPPIYTFGQPSEWNPACLAHPSYSAPQYVAGWEESAKAAANTHIANLS